MQYDIRYDNPDESLTTRLLKIRKIEDSLEDFLDPSYAKYRQSPHDLHDMDLAVQRIISAIDAGEKIIIFGDYDVDGITSSYILYTFFRKFLDYHQISVRLPHRTKDGYGIKNHHLDQLLADGCQLVITVDNGITAHGEALYAKEL